MMVLKSFAAINPSILFKPGNKLSTVSPQKTILASATLSQELEHRFAIYDLPKFLGVLSMFESPNIIFNTNSMTIEGVDRQVEYRFADEKNVIVPPEKDITLPSIDVEFALTESMISDIQKASGILSAPEIAIKGNGKKMVLTTFNTKDKESDSYKIDLGKTDKTFNFVFKGENWRLIPQDYKIFASQKGLVQFKGSKNVEVDYWITLEAKSSSFEK
jgi:hypothetical protein